MFLRLGPGDRDAVAVVLNATPVPRRDEQIGVPFGDCWEEALNGDDAVYGGSGVTTGAPVDAEPEPWQGQPWSVRITLPPLSVVFLQPRGAA